MKILRKNTVHKFFRNKENDISTHFLRPLEITLTPKTPQTLPEINVVNQ